jgi:hypothetical protein
MFGVAFFFVMISVITVSVVCRYAEYHFTEYHFSDCHGTFVNISRLIHANCDAPSIIFASKARNLPLEWRSVRESTMVS